MYKPNTEINKIEHEYITITKAIFNLNLFLCEPLYKIIKQVTKNIKIWYGTSSIYTRNLDRFLEYI